MPPKRNSGSSGQGRSRSTRAKKEELSAASVAELAVDHLTSLTSREAIGVTSVEPLEDGWLVEIEVLEQRRVPSSADMLALYQVEIDMNGDLGSYRRTSRYPRNQTQSSSVGDGS